MRAPWIYTVVALLSAAWPCTASPLAGRSASTAVVEACEATTTTSGPQPLREEGEGDEALREVAGRATRWRETPGLVVLTSVMEYQQGARAEYQATSARVSDDDAKALVADLTGALAVLTGNTFTTFADVRMESAPAGTMVSVMRSGQIVVGRYRGVRDQLKTIGVGGRSRRGRSITGGTVFLDDDYDRTSSKRALLRTHELGHALGYDHIVSRPSIMNPRIGAAITAFDRRAALVAFRDETPAPPTCPL